MYNAVRYLECFAGEENRGHLIERILGVKISRLYVAEKLTGGVKFLKWNTPSVSPYGLPPPSKREVFFGGARGVSLLPRWEFNWIWNHRSGQRTVHCLSNYAVKATE